MKQTEAVTLFSRVVQDSCLHWVSSMLKRMRGDRQDMDIWMGVQHWQVVGAEAGTSSDKAWAFDMSLQTSGSPKAAVSTKWALIIDIFHHLAWHYSCNLSFIFRLWASEGRELPSHPNARYVNWWCYTENNGQWKGLSNIFFKSPGK